MYLELKADDVMPFGKYIGITLREVYKKDSRYFEKLCEQTDDYEISDTTQQIIRNDLSQEEKSIPSFSTSTKNSRSELKADDKIIGGPYSGKTLYEVFLENESYYRYLCIYRNYISEDTYYDMLERKNGTVEETIDDFLSGIDTEINSERFSISCEFKNKLTKFKESTVNKIYSRLCELEKIEYFPKCEHYWSESLEKILRLSDSLFEKSVARIKELQDVLDFKQLYIEYLFKIVLRADEEYQQIFTNYRRMCANQLLKKVLDSEFIKNELLILDSKEFNKAVRRANIVLKSDWVSFVESDSSSIYFLIKMDKEKYMLKTDIFIDTNCCSYSLQYTRKLVGAYGADFDVILERYNELNGNINIGAIKAPSDTLKCKMLFEMTNLEFKRKMEMLVFEQKQRDPNYIKNIRGSLNLGKNEFRKDCFGDCSTCKREKCLLDN